jgi:predicted SnoaL-like aldol condensation-catalyzing enzyme
MVVEFYQELFVDKNPEAINKFIGEKFIQHNPGLPDGKEALLQAVKVWFKDEVYIPIGNNEYLMTYA